MRTFSFGDVLVFLMSGLAIVSSSGFTAKKSTTTSTRFSHRTGPMTQVPAQPHSLERKLVTRSKIECAKKCMDDGACQSFSFDKYKTMCTISRDILEETNTGNKVFWPAQDICPTNKGYTFVLKHNFCYRYYKNLYTYAMAKSTCEQVTRGHLVTIENAEMYDIVTDILYILQNFIPDIIWIDGDKISTSDYSTWEKNPLPWSLWSPLDILKLFKCVTLNGIDYRYYSSVCFTPFYFMCQKDTTL